MAAATPWAFTNSGRTTLLQSGLGTLANYKVALFLSTSNLGAASTTYAGVTNEVANGVGYTTGGVAVTLTLSGTTTVTVTWSVDPVWTASGGSITARFAGLYLIGGNIVAFSTLDSTPADVTATDSNTFTVKANVLGLFTLS